MTAKLFFGAIIKFLLGVVLVGALIFVPAGTLAFAYGWVLMGVLFIPMLLAGAVMMLKSPELLEKRLNAKEKRGKQSLVVKLSGLVFLVGFILAGLGFRFGWYVLPSWAVTVASCVFLLSYVMYAEVLRENAYLSRTVEIQEGQKVIDTGLYGVVRHPMYAATVLMFLSLPLVLGSVFSFLIFLAYPFIIASRIKDEEALLCEQLEGYAEYRTRVKYRLIPFIW